MHNGDMTEEETHAMGGVEHSNSVEEKANPLDYLPEEILQNHIVGILDTSSIARLSLVSRGFFNNSTRVLEKRRVERLIYYVLTAQLDKAVAMIANKPELLTESAKVVDLSGRTIEGTAFQAALGALDIPMIEAILLHMSHEEASKQFRAQFPNGIQAERTALQQAAFNFPTLVETMIAGNVVGALKSLQDAIKPSDVIKKGLHFNPYFLMGADTAYATFYRQLAQAEMTTLFWTKVIGLLQRQLPAAHVNLYLNGLHNLLAIFREYDHNRLEIAVRLNEGEIISFYDPQLGDTHAVYASSGSLQRNWPSDQAAAGRLEKITLLKTTALTQIGARLGIAEPVVPEDQQEQGPAPMAL